VGTFHFEKKEAWGGIERTGKNITNRKRKPPNSGQLPENDKTTFSGVVILFFTVAGFAQKSRPAIWDG